MKSEILNIDLKFSTGIQKQRCKDSNPVERVWKPLALPGAHRYENHFRHLATVCDRRRRLPSARKTQMGETGSPRKHKLRLAKSRLTFFKMKTPANQAFVEHLVRRFDFHISLLELNSRQLPNNGWEKKPERYSDRSASQ